MLKLLLSFLFQILIFITYAQAQFTLNMGNKLVHEEKNSRGIVPLTKFSNNYLRVDEDTFDVVFPKNFEPKDTVYTKLFFQGQTGIFEREILCIIANRHSEVKTIYVDHNNNFNFTDDGSPIQTQPQDTAVDIFLKNEQYPSARFGYKILFRHGDDSLRIQQLNEMFGVYEAQKRGIKRLTVDQWFLDQRLNCKIVMDTLNGEYVKIALHDYNCNGRFDDVEDIYFIGETSENFIPQKRFGALTLEGDSLFATPLGKVYQIKQVEPAGDQIKLVSSAKTFKPVLRAGDSIPRLWLPTLDGDTVQLSDLIEPDKYLLIDVWGSWCTACKILAPELKKV